MGEPLWSNADIRTALTQEQATMVAERIRDDYEARIADLERQLAQRSEWEPVTGGELACECSDPDCERFAWVSDGTVGMTDGEADVCMTLPDGYDLCRRTSSEEAPDA